MKKSRMNNRLRKMSVLALAVVGLLFMQSCTKENVTQVKSKLRIEATDAPIDNVEVQAVFVTVSEIWIDGNKVEGFNSTTVEVSSLTDGRTELLDEIEIEASQVNNVTLVIDNKRDENGQMPGSYVLKLDGSKDALAEGMIEVSSDRNIMLGLQSEESLVFDFDLRKIISEDNGDFEFVTMSELQSSVRTEIKSETNNIMGELDTTMNDDSKWVVFLYKEGTFDLETEIQGQGENQIEFAGAVTSAKVNSEGRFQLSFVQDGDYDIHMIRFEDLDSDGDFEVTGEAKLSNDINISGMGFNLDGDTNIELGIKTLITL